jgi:4-hydroxy-tetrahydrodipicolinate synthase
MVKDTQPGCAVNSATKLTATLEQGAGDVPSATFEAKGLIVPPVTPYDQHGEVDYGAIRAHVDFLIDKGVQGLYPGGTTGEGPLLSSEERRKIAEAMIEQARGRVPVIVQAGALTTRATIELALHARDAGANAVAAVTPWYYNLSDAALIAYYSAIAEALDGYPLFLYNIPGNTGNNLKASVVAEIAAQHPNLIGIKDSSGNLGTTLEMLQLRDGHFQVVTGPDGLLLASLALGVKGNVSGNANVVPELFVTVYDAFARGDLVAARTAQAQIDVVRSVLKDGSDLSLFKAMVARRGVPMGGVRAPLLAAPQSAVYAALEALTAAGIAMD